MDPKKFSHKWVKNLNFVEAKLLLENKDNAA